MSSSANSNRKFWIYTVVTLAGSALVAAGYVVPQALDYAKSASVNYTVAALNEQGSEAAIDYRLASALDHSNEAAAVGLARVYLANGQSAEAMKLLSRVGDNADALRLKLQTHIERGRYAEAKQAADKLVSSSNEGDLVLAAAAYTLGGYNVELAALDGRLASVQALQALAKLKAGDLPRALELRALGLPVSSSAILVKLPPSTPRSLALGQLLLAKGDKASLAKAADYLDSGIKLDPANIELRTTYSEVLTAQKNLEAASLQDKLVLRIRQGRL